MSELNGQGALIPKPEPALLNELLIGGPMHGKTAMIPENRDEWFLFPPAPPLTAALDGDPSAGVSVAQLYLRAALSGDVGPDGATVYRTLFRHHEVSYEQAFAALTDMLLTAWIKGEVQLGG